MKTFLFIFLAGYAVRCDDLNYYVVQMPENDVPTKEFNIYWNAPTMQCKSKGILFDDLYEKYGIIQNTGDTFRGDRISILYDPGDFPALLRNSTSGEIKYRNGGVPQEGDLIEHLDTYQQVLEQSIPDKDFSGVGIIDFESWRPVFRQNFGDLTPYKDMSYEIEKQRHWWWKKEWIQEEAKRRFEAAGREFMQATLALSKKMRPRAIWGYYGFPYCFNMASNNMKETCADKVPQENDRISWLWQESTALYPSVYSSASLTTRQLAALIRGRVKEAARMVRGGAPILPYFWYRYRDSGFLNKTDLYVALNTFYKSNASGFIIWGSSNDVNTVDKCNQLRAYVTNILGPAIAKYTKQNMRQGDDPEVILGANSNPNNSTTFDPEFNWIPPENYTQTIEEIVDKELKEEKEIGHKNVTESILVDMILNNIADSCGDGCDSASKDIPTDVKEEDTDVIEMKGDEDSATNESQVVVVTEDPFKKNSSVITGTASTTTEEYSYDYDVTGPEDINVEDVVENVEYSDISTTSKDIVTVSTTAKSIEVYITTSANSEASTYSVSREDTTERKEETSTQKASTTDTEDFTLRSEQNNAIELNIEENSIESSTVYPTNASTTEFSISTYSTTSPNEEEATIENELNSTENKTDDTVSDSSTTLAPVSTEQVVVSVV
ncbi:hyaluronidase-like isoform X2 [Spodoptera litura]|uniref:Hyaluronidase n=1 Tax=Spodoptera litura TaxID=69820 RepID=A0A9J7J652_SPOLT|nr:hyaluronidase-like isoform X2 [Spodoptera litura]